MKLTGSMFFLSTFSHCFRLMVGLQVDGPLGVVLSGSKGLCGWSWAAPMASVGGPGPLSGPLWVVLGRSQGLWAVLGRLGTFVGGPRSSWVPSSVSFWRSWADLGAYVGGLGPKSGENMATWNMCLFLRRERDLRPQGRS